MKNNVFVVMAAIGLSLNMNAQQSEAKFTTGSSTTITSNTDDAPFRVAVRDNASAMNGYIDIGPQNPTWAHFVTDRPRFYMNQPLFINNAAVPGNGGVLSSYNGLPLVLSTGDVNTLDATPYYVPRITINTTGESVYGHVTGQRWRMDPRTGNNGDYFNLGYDDAGGTFNTQFSIFRAGNIPRIAVGQNYGTMYSTFNVITRSNGQASSSAVSMKFGEPGTGSGSHGMWNMVLCEDPSVSTKCNLVFWATDAALGNASPVMALFNNGNVSIAEKLTCREVLVNANVPWPDYVFSTNYNLRPLSEVESFIKKNNHLPDVPSEKQIAEQGGANLGEMNTVLLRKIEELTLYTIEQQKAIDLLKQEVGVLKTSGNK